MSLLAQINNAAHTGAFGHNPRSEPTLAQLAAGNYKKGVVMVKGLSIAIENPAYTYRKGMDKTGQQWMCLMQAHYGYIQGHKGNDGDDMDVFIGVAPENDTVYIVNQKTADGYFDEHKIMLGFLSQQQAVDTYQHCFERGFTGLMSVVPCTMTQFKWWLANGDKSRPVTLDRLPYAGLERLDSVNWGGTDGSNLYSHDGQVHKLLYQIRQCDDTHQALEPLAYHDMIAELGNQGFMYESYDALVVEYNKLEKKAKQLLMVMQGAADTVKPVGVTVSKPLTKGGVANVVAWFEMDDGQAVGVFFHNPDKTPKKINPTDEMISYKWVLNKKDITIAVAPEQGKDLIIRTVAKRIMLLVEKNHDRFIKANGDKAALNQAEQDLSAQVAEKQATLKGLQDEVAALQVRKAEKEALEIQVQADTNTRISQKQEALAGILAINKDLQKQIDDAGKQVDPSKIDFKEGDFVRFMPTKESQLTPSFEGMVISLNSTTGGAWRVDVRTNKPLPRGNGFMVARGYTDGGTFLKIDEPVVSEDLKIQTPPLGFVGVWDSKSGQYPFQSITGSKIASFATREEAEKDFKASAIQPQEPVTLTGKELGDFEPIQERPLNWRTNLANARAVAKSLGIETKGKKLANLVGEINGKDSIPVVAPVAAPTPAAKSTDLTDEEYAVLKKAYDEFKAKTDKIGAAKSREDALKIATDLVAEIPEKEEQISRAFSDAIRDNKWGGYEINFPKQPVKVGTDMEINRTLKRLQKALEGTEYSIHGTFKNKFATLEFAYGKGFTGKFHVANIEKRDDGFFNYDRTISNWRTEEVLKPLMDATVDWLNGKTIPKMMIGEDLDWYANGSTLSTAIYTVFNEAKAKAAPITQPEPTPAVAQPVEVQPVMPKYINPKDVFLKKANAVYQDMDEMGFNGFAKKVTAIIEDVSNNVEKVDAADKRLEGVVFESKNPLISGEWRDLATGKSYFFENMEYGEVIDTRKEGRRNVIDPWRTTDGEYFESLREAKAHELETYAKQRLIDDGFMQGVKTKDKPQPASESPTPNPDRDYLQSIIDGEVDPLTVDMDAVIALAEKYDGDTEITPLLDQALEVINQAEQELAKGI